MSALHPILPKARFITNNIIISDDDGFPLGMPQHVLIDTSESEERIKEMHPRFYEYLLSRKDSIISRTLVRVRHPWYRQERRDPAPFLCTYMGRGGIGKDPIRFLRNHSKALATNVYLLLYPLPKLRYLLEQEPELYDEVYTALCEVAAHGMSEYGRVYGGGLRKIEPRELANVRLLSKPNWLNGLIEKGLFDE